MNTYVYVYIHIHVHVHTHRFRAVGAAGCTTATAAEVSALLEVHALHSEDAPHFLCFALASYDCVRVLQLCCSCVAVFEVCCSVLQFLTVLHIFFVSVWPLMIEYVCCSVLQCVVV